MVLVIAIIVILVTVMFLSVANYMSKATTARDKASSHNSAVDSVVAEIL